MRTFDLWAPRAGAVSIELNGARRAMTSTGAHGWWRVEGMPAEAGADYGFLIDDDPVLYPDPRSAWQPRGVHAPSRVYDQGAFVWTDRGFRPPPLASGVVYELHVGTFTVAGTLDAAIDRLDALSDLGVTHLELMPVAAFAGEFGWGYDGVALFAVHEPYGGPDALKRFVDAAHARGLAVLLDVVYNHFGPVGNYAVKFAPYLIEAHKTPWGGAVNLEARGSREVRRFFCDNALMWLRDYHIDGLRLDAVHALVDRSAIHFLEQLAAEVKTLGAVLGKDLVLIAESDLNDPRMVEPLEIGGLGMDAQWSDDFHHALFTVLNQEQEPGYYTDFGSLAQLAKAIEHTFVFDGIFSKYRDRVHGRPVRGLSQHRFLSYIQNHDQIGNRAIGDRVAAIVGLARARIAAALVLTGPFVPLLFQGEEWAATTPFQYFANHDDRAVARAVSAGRRKEFAAFGWDPDLVPDPESRATFLGSKLDWDESGREPHAAMRTWYRDLIRLRHATVCLNDGERLHTRVAFDETAQWLLMERGPVAVVCNLSPSLRTIALERRGHLVLASDPDVAVKDLEVMLPSDTVAILRLDVGTG